MMATNIEKVLVYNRRLHNVAMKTITVDQTRFQNHVHVVQSLILDNLKQLDTVTQNVKELKWEVEINIIGEFLLCFFNVRAIRTGSFISEFNRCLRKLIKFISIDEIEQERINLGKRIRRSALVFMAMILKEMSPYNKEILLCEFDKLIKEAAIGDSFYNKVLDCSHHFTIVSAFYDLISSEVDLYDNNRYVSIIFAFEKIFEDNEKRCTYLNEKNEVLADHWRFFY